MLDKLADVKQRGGAVKPRDYQAKIMTPMLLRMDGQEVAWLCRIILKLEMKIGMQEKALLDELHVDANGASALVSQNSAPPVSDSLWQTCSTPAATCARRSRWWRPATPASA